MPSRHALDFDPLDEALKPPPDESDSEHAIRLAQEAEAKRVSQAIDDSLRAERQLQKKKNVVRLLLLGQSESDFQRLYTPNAFREERVLWRSVIQLNLVRSIRTILDALSNVRIQQPIDSGGDESDDGPNFPQELDFLKMRLAPLRHIEALLIAKLVPPNEDEAISLPASSSVSNYQSTRSRSSERSWRTQEVFVRALAKSSRANGRPHSFDAVTPGSRDEAQEVLHSCRHDIMTLWNDRTVREILRKRKIRLEEFPGFFLNDLERVTSLKYTPNDDDVLKARLKTVGVSEYRFEMEAAAGRESGTEWRIVDVGGSRSQRRKATWVPFFDDVDAIIFLAPISGFDQVLAEDRSVNRLEDSVLLWKAVCSNKLLANVELVLFLNKCDILDAKLKAGVRLSRYVRSFSDRPNDLETASKYFRSKFSAIHREYSPNPRKFYGFCTSVTDTTTTAGILASVRDMVIRQHLKQSKLL
ncbi:hypothetical protein SERLADRAFT_445016 [Serpula lacrymans var. lacrymans S7.9]|uniref:G-alpha-domain-containing protein n=1 Tax=Serpula lacrymans var. lacrymans (strain S7.9) TaxID=578457 RepID=F8NHL6_SERL9|nr:uncharacterized protein SERLADRAFT_445016 [Serpula lacrymans var. lacrymans S7.9]EGO29187.1 hypothetical protein SERLADRAFT_445016 [Serpula lacrymans var. lacrymans S7.9]